MTRKISEKTGAILAPLSRPWGAFILLCGYSATSRHIGEAGLWRTSQQGEGSTPQTGDSALQRARVPLEYGKIPHSSRYPASQPNTLQSLYPLLPICAKCQGDKPVFFLLGFTRWLCQFCADQSFSLFSYTFFSEVCEVILV